VASDAAHRSSAEIIRSCVKNALAHAEAAGCRSVAMPLFAAGHAGFDFDGAVTAMAEALRDDTTSVKQLFIVVYDRERAEEALRLIRSVIPSAEIDMQQGPDREDETAGMWSDDWL
jgi:O-acetyl-ADP-ribose deacetylase (regulator of RNase III)